MRIVNSHNISYVSSSFFLIFMQDFIYYPAFDPPRDIDCASFHRRTHLKIYRKTKLIMFPLRDDRSKFLKFFLIEIMNGAVQVPDSGLIFKKEFLESLSFDREM